MKANYRIEISFTNSLETFNSISEVLGVKPISSRGVDIPNNWCYEITVGDHDLYFDFINEFLNITEGKYEALSKLGIERKDIVFWMLYEYDQQCNLEFDLIKMKRLGDNGIGICISCWNSGRESIG